MEILILNGIQMMRTPILDWIMCFITSLGNGGWIWLVLFLALFIYPKTRKLSFVLLAALILDAVCTTLLKKCIQRIRPCDVNTSIQLLISRPHDYSFPSGHTSISFAAVTILYFVHKKNIFKISVILAILIAFSRLYLYVHYPTDVLAGMLVGLGCGFIIWKISNSVLIGINK